MPYVRAYWGYVLGAAISIPCGHVLVGNWTSPVIGAVVGVCILICFDRIYVGART